MKTTALARKVNWKYLADALPEEEVKLKLNWSDRRTRKAIVRQARLMGFESPTAYLHPGPGRRMLNACRKEFGLCHFGDCIDQVFPYFSTPGFATFCKSLIYNLHRVGIEPTTQ